MDTILTYVNFNESYTMKVQNKIQNMPRHNMQIGILVMITYKYNPTYI
jgi:hypothetical protein